MRLGAFALVMTVPALTAASSPEAEVTADELRRHVATLAADSLEGREAGRRGGKAAAAYLMTELKRLAVRPAGEGGEIVQEFGPGYKNLLVTIPGADERLRHEVVVIGAHYDHVGLGTGDNSFGPVGRIHNGADDNASGTAAALELAEAFAFAEPKPKRTLLFAFWDAEEKGLLGSAHWVARPTVPLAAVKFAFNLDMLGRLRDRRLEVYGVRTAVGLRRLVSEQNLETDLTLDFDWTQRDDSDHWSFYKRRIPYLMPHTGLHEQYHRPTDDADLINLEGLANATEFCRKSVVAVADAPAWEFRTACETETNETSRRQSAALPPPASRLGVRWDAARGDRGEFVVSSVQTGSSAATAGIRRGDRIAAVNGITPADTAAIRRIVLAASADASLGIVRGGEAIEVPVRLAGPPIRVGITWREDPAEPGVVILRRVVEDSPAADAGLKVTDRILAVDGRTFADEPEFRRLFESAGETPELTVERDGRTLQISLTLPVP